MELKNYQEQSARTLPDLGSQGANGIHMGAGIASEFGEMLEGMERNDLPNIIEEHGDGNWYIAGVCTIYGFSYETLYNETQPAGSEIHVMSIFKLLDLFKAEFAYGKAIDLILLRKYLGEVLSVFMKAAVEKEFNQLESLQKNIDKLKQRFPDKFDADKAINRDVVVEREILES